MELGDLEVEILHILSARGEARPREVHSELQKTHPVAYTTVTNTLYRLVEKGLVTVRRVGPKRAYYASSGDARAQARAAGGLLSRLVRAFGPDAVSRLIAEERRAPRRRTRRKS